MIGRRVLVVEDDEKVAALVGAYLERDGYRVEYARDGHVALDMIRRTRPDAVILDLLLPELDGRDVLRLVRAESGVPVLVLSALSADDDRLRGLDLGADDYITKPFNPREVVARVRAVLWRARRGDLQEVDRLVTGGLEIDLRRHQVRVDGRTVELTPTEFRLLEVLAREPGRAFTRPQLVDEVLGYDYEGLERTIDAHVMNLRRKIEPDPASPRYICTVFGVGYKLAEAP